MKKLLPIIVVSLLFLSACGNSFNPKHTTFLENEGWHIKNNVSKKSYIFDLPTEMLANYEASGITFIQDIQNQKVAEFIYLLKEKDSEGNPLQAVIYEIDGELVGGYGILPNYTPGLFSLTEKEHLIIENMIQY